MTICFAQMHMLHTATVSARTADADIRMIFLADEDMLSSLSFRPFIIESPL
jgi:hypothetical protein